MKSYRRQRQQYLFAGLLAALALINLLFFLILYRPARSEYVSLQESIQKTRSDIQSRRRQIERLEKLNAQLETFAQDREQLLTHFIPKERGWSEILPHLEDMVQKASVKNLRKDYSPDGSAQYGLYSVKIRLPISGTYQNVVNFVRDIENAQTFFIIRSIEVRGGTVATPELTMTLNLETFFYQ